MRVVRFMGEDFRNFKRFEFSPHNNVNIIFGDNGSGKTSLLEALYLFGFGRSFRPGGFRPLINSQAEKFTLFIEAKSDFGDALNKFGMARYQGGDNQIRINGGGNTKLSELASYFPVQLFTPESVDVVYGGPSGRRQLIDWGVFHVEHSFFQVWSNYNKVLQHRNKLLKRNRSNYSLSQDKFWLDQLKKYGEKITLLRKQYLSNLRKYFLDTTKLFLPNVTLDVSLKLGWDQNKTFEEALTSALDSDLKYGHTTVGPHKADLTITADGVSAREYLSRGQMKVLVASLKLSQAQLLRETTGKSCIIIVDDLTSELDRENQKKFCAVLENSGSQVFLSTVSINNLTENFKERPEMFHVEQGILKRHIEK